MGMEERKTRCRYKNWKEEGHHEWERIENVDVNKDMEVFGKTSEKKSRKREKMENKEKWKMK